MLARRRSAKEEVEKDLGERETKKNVGSMR